MPQARACRAAAPDDHAKRDAGIPPGLRGHDQPVEQDLVLVVVTQREDIDDGVVRGGGPGLGEDVADVLVHVGGEDDATSVSLGETGQGGADGPADVGPVRLNGGSERGDVASGMAQRQIDVRVAVEADDRQLVRSLAEPGTAADILLDARPQFVRDAAGPVDQKEDGEPIGSHHALGSREDQGEQGNQQASQDDGQGPPWRVQAVQGALRHQGDHRDRQTEQQPPGLVK